MPKATSRTKVTGDLHERLHRWFRFYFGDPKQWPRNAYETASFLYHAEEALKQTVVIQAAKQKNVGGNPGQHDWDAFWIEIVRIANTPDGLPDRPALMKRMCKFVSEQWEKQPGDPQIRDKLSRLYQPPKR
jgi:hypothetical protein